MLMKPYGLRVFPAGFIVHRDDWPLIRDADGTVRVPRLKSLIRCRRTVIRAFSESSRRRLELIAANAFSQFKTIITITQHAKCESWEGEDGRNLRIVKRSKRDLNRFLTCLRRVIGEYLWAQVQRRAVVH
jgi:hypothetical protein